MARTSNTPLSRFGIKENLHERRNAPDEARGQSIALAEKNATITELLAAVDGPAAFAPAMRVARLGPEQLAALFATLHPVVADDVDGFATDTAALLGPVCDRAAVSTLSRQLAQSYLAYLNPANQGNRDAVLSDMLRLYQALTPALGSAELADPDAPTKEQMATNAQEAIHRIFMNVSYQLTSELKDARSNAAQKEGR